MSANRAETLEQLARLCRTGRAIDTVGTTEPSEFSELDAMLPGEGWAVGTIVELMPHAMGIGEFRLLLPTLARMTRAEHHVALISPPYIPFAPALAQHGLALERLLVINAATSEDTLWAFEQTLRCKSFGAVVAWPSAVKDREIRRLQLAAEAGRSIGFVYRPPSAALESSPAAVRLKLQASETGLSIDILKCRGTRGGFSVTVDALTLDAPTLPSAAQDVRMPRAHGCAGAAPVRTGEEVSYYPLVTTR
jgi:hypothetical protein